jgi:hypothetical protein
MKSDSTDLFHIEVFHPSFGAKILDVPDEWDVLGLKKGVFGA